MYVCTTLSLGHAYVALYVVGEGVNTEVPP